jgi:hypothetical protein
LWGVESMNRRFVFVVASGALLVLLNSAGVLANVALTQISSDPFTNPSSQHATEVEPDTLSSGATFVSGFQQGRFFNGGASDVGFSTSTNGGSSFKFGSIPEATKLVGGKTYDRASDASIAFDAMHKVWLESFLGIIAVNPAVESSFRVDVLVSRSTNGGKTFSPPVAIDAPGNQFFDKNWTVCDNTSTSPFFGHCYTEFDNNSALDLILMSTSTDGGLTWGPALPTANHAIGLGGQPLVQPNGTVVVPIINAFETHMMSFVSTDGGASWGPTNVISVVRNHSVAGGIRTSPLPTAEIDGAGNVFVAWQDCRFRVGCTSNDIVFASSSNGVKWSDVMRVPIDPVGSGADHFIPGLAVDPTSAGTGARLALTFYFYPNAACTAATCQLDIGFIDSTNGGVTWSSATMLAGPISLSWLPETNQGVMVGDYISTSFVSGGGAKGAFAVASAPSGGLFDEAILVPSAALPVLGGAVPSSAAIVSSNSDHPELPAPATAQ